MVCWPAITVTIVYAATLYICSLEPCETMPWTHRARGVFLAGIDTGRDFTRNGSREGIVVARDCIRSAEHVASGMGRDSILNFVHAANGMAVLN